MSRSLSPVTARQLHRLLTRVYGGTVLTQVGSHLTIRMPNGAEVGCLDPCGTERPIPFVLLRSVATGLGRDLTWLMSELGHAPGAGGRKTGKTAQGAPIGRSEANKAARELAGDLLAICKHMGDARRSYGPRGAQAFRSVAQLHGEIGPAVRRVRQLVEATS